MQVGPFLVTEEFDLLGVHYWVQHYQYRVPAFEVFEYFGQDRKAKLFFFHSRDDKTIIHKTLDQLGTDFRPFLLNLKKLEATWEDLG